MFLFALLSTSTFAQTGPIEKVDYSGYKYALNGDYLHISDLNDILISNEEAHRLIYDARQYRGLSQVMGSIGGFMLGWQVGKSLAGDKFDTIQGLIGAGLMGLSIPIYYGQNKKIECAVDIYNDGFSESTKVPTRLSLVTSANSIGFSFTF